METMTLALLAALFAVSAHADTQFHLTEKCTEQLKNSALKLEREHLTARGERLATKLQAGISLSYYPNRPTVKVRVELEDPADGRFVRYSAAVLKSEAIACDVSLIREDKSACRYSRGEGPESLNEIAGLRFDEGRRIQSFEILSAIEERQIRAFLAPVGSGEDRKSTKELIEATDDQDLGTGTLAMENGRTLDYYGAFSGDSSFGIYFISGTTNIAGSNNDGFICIK